MKKYSLLILLLPKSNIINLVPAQNIFFTKTLHSCFSANQNVNEHPHQVKWLAIIELEQLILSVLSTKQRFFERRTAVIMFAETVSIYTLESEQAPFYPPVTGNWWGEIPPGPVSVMRPSVASSDSSRAKLI